MSESVMSITELGNKYWRNSSGQLHRTDGPAIDWISGVKQWHINGKLHRLNGPAVEWVDGEKVYYVNDKFLGYNDEGFWKLWGRLTSEQKGDHTLLSYLPEKF